MDETDFTDQFVPTFVNQEPEVIKGLTQLELMFCLGSGFVFGVVSAVLIGIFVGLIAGLISMIFLGILSGFILAKKIKSIKAGKPKGYMSVALRKRAISWFGNSVNKEGFYLFDERLTIGRSNIPMFEVVERREEDDE